MNQAQIEYIWDHLRGQVKKKWTLLADEEVKKAKGDAKVLAGNVEIYYGKSKEHALKEVRDFLEVIKMKH